MRARQAQALQLAMDLGALLPLESSASLCLSDVSWTDACFEQVSTFLTPT
jgi:hypothetical protein